MPERPGAFTGYLESWDDVPARADRRPEPEPAPRVDIQLTIDGRGVAHIDVVREHRKNAASHAEKGRR